MYDKTEKHQEESVFPEYIYFTHKQSYIHTNIHTIHTYNLTFIQIHISLLDFFFYYKKQFDILLLCIRCYTVRARSLLKSMHFLLVVSWLSICKWLLGACFKSLSVPDGWWLLSQLGPRQAVSQKYIDYLIKQLCASAFHVFCLTWNTHQQVMLKATWTKHSGVIYTNTDWLKSGCVHVHCIALIF